MTSTAVGEHNALSSPTHSGHSEYIYSVLSHPQPASIRRDVHQLQHSAPARSSNLSAFIPLTSQLQTPPSSSIFHILASSSHTSITMCKIIRVYFPACRHTVVHHINTCTDPTMGALVSTSFSASGLDGLNEHAKHMLRDVAMRQQCLARKPVLVETETCQQSTKKCPNCEEGDRTRREAATRMANRYNKIAKDENRNRLINKGGQGN